MVGDKRSRPAKVLDHSPITDTALLSIIDDGLPYVRLGDESVAQESDPVTLITFLPDNKIPLLITGNISGKGAIQIGNINANVIIAQLPIKKGFSGSPIFDRTGSVIGAVNTRLVGISTDLDATRKILSGPRSGYVFMQGINPGDTFLSLINSLDADLVSGLGSATSISYTEEMYKNAQTAH